MKPEKFEAVCGGETIRINVSVDGMDVILILRRQAMEDTYRVLCLTEGGTATLSLGHVPENQYLFTDPRASHILFTADQEGLKHIKKVLKEALEARPIEITPKVEHSEVVWRDEKGKVYSRQGMKGTVEVDNRLTEKHYER